MTKDDFINKCTIRLNTLPRKQVDIAVNSILEQMTNALVEGRRIEVRGFGSFRISVRKAKIGRNPKSGKACQVPEKRIPHFKPGKELRERVNIISL